MIYNLLCIAVFLSYLGNIYRRPSINGINIKKIKKRKTKKRISKRKRNELVQQTCEWAIVPLPRVTKR